MSNNAPLDLHRLTPWLLQQAVRDTPLLARLREETARDPLARMQVSADQGQFLGLMVKLTGARRLIEVGTFTGYSSLCMALAMPEDGHLLCCDVSENWTAVARRYWQEAGVDRRITLRLAPALDTLDACIAQGDSGCIDLIFIDADKERYSDYYARALTLLRPGGLMLIDNTLWSGRVADPAYQDVETVAIRALNERIRQDDRVDFSLLPLADGVTLVRKR